MRGRIRLSGGAGEFITGGRTIAAESPSTTISIVQNGVGDLTITIGDGPGDWQIDLATADNKPLQQRRYSNAQQYPFADPGRPSLSVSGNGHGCNQLRGDYEIQDVAYDGKGQLTGSWPPFVSFVMAPQSG
jgi:hypothetical protein